MHGKYLLFQLFFIISVFVNLFVNDNLFLKILLVFLLFLFGLLILPEFQHNKNKFLFTGIGFVILSILFLFAGYFINLTYIIVLTCILVVFFYCSKVLFSTSYGEVIFSTDRTAQIKIKDVFYNLNKIYSIETSKKIASGSIVSICLDNSILRKPTKIIDVICESTTTIPKTSKTQKIPKKAIKTRKNTKISKKKKR